MSAGSPLSALSLAGPAGTPSDSGDVGEAIAWQHRPVLIVEDQSFNRTVLENLLRKGGMTNLAFAQDGIEGLAKVESFRPDLILLDVQMPRMDGLEMCRRLRQNPLWSDLPVVFQTSMTGNKERVACFQAGGTDMISKPINAKECIARLRIHLERRLLIHDLKDFRDRMTRELAMARSMQAALVPEERWLRAISNRHNICVQAEYEACTEVGGDLWTLFEFDSQRIGLLLLDFTGHGIAAAINAFRLHTLIGRLPPDPEDPAGWFQLLNASLKPLLPTGQYATGFFCVLDTQNRHLTYTGAGAPDPMLITNDRIERLDGSGVFLGISRMGAFENREATLPPDADLFLFSDALTEATDHGTGRMIGESGLEALVQEAMTLQREQRLPHLLDRFHAHAGNSVEDDLTAVWISWPNSKFREDQSDPRRDICAKTKPYSTSSEPT